MDNIAAIASTGSYLPKKILTNTDLSKLVETSDEWIRDRTGMVQRHIAEDNELTSDMAANAARRALENAHLEAQDIDLIIVATTTPDQTFPSVATKVQSLIGASHAASFDVQAVCSGFIYALSIANNFIIANQAKNILVIGAEKMSSILDWTDRTTCVLFGDGAGAVVLRARPHTEEQGILSTHLASDGRYRNILYTDSGIAGDKHIGHIRMNGQEVFKHAATKMASSIETILSANHLSKEHIDWVVPHQANVRILEMLSKKLHLSMDKVVNCIPKHANTSAASIPLALDDANTRNIFTPGQIIVLTAIGGGLTWGSVVLKW